MWLRAFNLVNIEQLIPHIRVIPFSYSVSTVFLAPHFFDANACLYRWPVRQPHSYIDHTLKT